ncbi:MAG TPA: putative Na+/H+ antiporter [Geobacteraceae bacterium]
MVRRLAVLIPAVPLLTLALLVVATVAWAGGGTAGLSFPPSLDSYGDAGLTNVWEILRNRVRLQPLNLSASLLFVGAVVHTFFTHKFLHMASVLEEQHRERLKLLGEDVGAGTACGRARLCHFLGEVEAVFGIWVVPLVALLAANIGIKPTLDYINAGVRYDEALFVVVVMAISSTRPILRLAEQCLALFARLGGGRPHAWWLSIITVGPLLGSLITEPAAMTISALLLGKRFFSCNPSRCFAYATLGLLFVNISVGGILTSFAAPPVLMVVSPWGWDTTYMFTNFGWIAVVGILISNLLHLLVFRNEFARLQSPAAEDIDGHDGGGPIPLWITLGHLVFMASAVYNVHRPAFLVGSFLFFLAFFEVTEDHQGSFQLRPPILVGFFLAGLVIHGGLQQWWIAPVLGSLRELPLMFGAMGLTAVNDNAAITYLSTLVPNMSESMKHAVMAGAVTGGGLTVIANAPNPAGQSILARHFGEGIAPLGLLLGALTPTVIMSGCFLFFS